MNKKYKIILVLVIIVIVSLLSYFFEQVWILLLYSTIISLFPGEIKNIFSHIFSAKQIRISYSYIFRIEVNGYYLLVKDEQGRNNYHPVGGVYKFNSEEVDISDDFEGSYDGLFNDTEDTQDDLRLIIKKNKLKKFKKWFSKEIQREILCDLSREFREELLERKILSIDIFKNIKYKYAGSYTSKSYNDILKMNQVRHYDIIDLKLTNIQKKYLKEINKAPTDLYLFATKNNIENGCIESGGNRYEIANYTKLILIGSPYKLSKEFDNSIEYSIKTT